MADASSVADDWSRLDKVQFLSLLSFFRLESIEAVLVAAAHRVRCDDFDMAKVLYTDLAEALKAHTLAGALQPTADERLRFASLVSSLSPSDTSAWLNLIEQNQCDLLTLQAQPIDPAPSINQALVPSSVHPVHRLAAEDEGEEAGTAQSRTPQRQRRKRTADHIIAPLVPVASHEEKKDKLRRGGSHRSSAKSQLVASITQAEEQSAVEEEEKEQMVEEQLMPHQQEHKEHAEEGEVHDCVFADGTEVADEEVDDGGDGPTSSPSTVSRWQRPRKRLVRFRLTEGEDERQQLQALEELYWKENEEDSVMASADEPAPPPS